MASVSWYRDHRLWLELFVLANLAFLAPDIFLAHSTNDFRHEAEYIPLVFSLAAPPVLLVAILMLQAWSRTGLWRVLGHIVGAAAVAVGVAGLLWHLDSQFFRDWTLASLVYTAPFAAPLAYTGLGLLLIMNRMVDPATEEWGMWVLLLALGGFVGNFIFSLADHAQNAFFHRIEWLSVASSAFAVSFLLVPFFVRVGPSYLMICVGILIVQVLVGLLGFSLHTLANVEGPSPSVFRNFVYGAPAMAPLLFPNLAVLAFLGLWVWRRHLPEAANTP
jgi:hypothetical protein